MDLVGWINADFQGRPSLKLDYDTTYCRSLAGSDFLARDTQGHISEVQKCLDGCVPVPAYDQPGIRLHCRLQRLLREARSV